MEINLDEILSKDDAKTQLEKILKELQTGVKFHSDKNDYLQRKIDALQNEVNSSAPYASRFSHVKDDKGISEKYAHNMTIKGRYMRYLFMYKDTNSRETETTVSDALDTILTVLWNACALKHDQNILRFADKDINLNDAKTLDIFSWVLRKPCEVAQDFSTFHSKRYFTEFVCEWGFTLKQMPYEREYYEALHLIKNCFKYMRETFVSMDAYHTSISCEVAAKEAARKIDGTFRIARRDTASYLIPYYIYYKDKEGKKVIVDFDMWHDSFYSDIANNYVDDVFEYEIYPVLRGKKD